MNRILAAAVALGAILALSAADAMANVERRVALVIGNSAYQHAPRLNNGVTDAQAMTAQLETLGFDVVSAYDTTFADMTEAIEEFAIRAFDADVSLFFYAGHGVGARGTNFLVPVDAAFDSPTALRTQAVDVATITDTIRIGDSVGLVFLDACRDNPFPEMLSKALGANVTRSMGFSRQGLSEMEIADPGKGLAIAFATSPGEVAYDGTGRHSPFTEALLKFITLKNTDVATVMSRVTGEVLRITDNRQRPWVSLSLTGPVILNPNVTVVSTPSEPSPAAPETALSPSLEAEKIVFQMAREIDEIAQYEAYLRRWPEGVFSDAARARVESLRAAEGRGTEVAALPSTGAEVDAAAEEVVVPAEAVAAEPLPTRTGPLVLAVTDAVRAALADEATEAALDMDRPKRREVQRRLTAAGANVGGADGIFGPMTRGGITAWQQRLGLPATGYLNQLQLELLTASTAGEVEPSRTAFAPPPAPVVTQPPRATQPTRVSRPQRTSEPARTSSRTSSTQRRTSSTTTVRRSVPPPEPEVYRPRTPQYP